ncbi:MAG: hemolysin III family protein [Gammaproteobacteria bacterium]|jgi:hemolysin III|nr:hemolysin III family protein [Gammaproteobacteria bacterium]HWR34217.1 hemolysin III family protein [Chitinophagaceae bacterium]
MHTPTLAHYYPPAEEITNIISHAIGFILSIVALCLLTVHAAQHGNALHITSFVIFGCSLIILYAASTLYHLAKKPELRNKLRVFDHACIYILIAGTYTPISLITLGGATGWVIFGLAWGLAVTGIVLKLFFTGKYNLVSTLMYIFMGWIILFAIKPLVNNLPEGGLIWLIIGGASYTIGAILYSIKQLKFNHAIFHIFVLLGSFSHFVTVYFFVLP